MKTIALLVLAGLAGSGVLVAGDNPLDAARAEYARRREAMQATRDGEVARTLAVYRRELDTLLANVRQQGNLDYVLAIENEVKRLEADGGAPTEPADPAFAHLRRIQWAARQAEDKADKDLTEQTDRLRAAYTAQLERIERTLVARNRIEEAKQAREEREAVEARAAMVGRWIWMNRFERLHKLDGTIWNAKEAIPIGHWDFLGFNEKGERQYRIETHKEYEDIVTLSADGTEFSWIGRTRRQVAVRAK